VLNDDELSAGQLIDGTWSWSTSAGAIDHVSPMTGKVQAQVPVAGADEADRAVQAAKVALPMWRATTRRERQALLQRIAAAIRADAEALGRMATFENGTPAMIGGFQISVAADTFDYYAGWIDKLTGDVLPADGSFSYTSIEPIGVVALVLTWNTPPPSFATKVAAALAAGCTVVVKAPELAPFTTTALGRLIVEAGTPAGVVNIVNGGPDVGDALVRHPDIDKISFTGSPESAAKIQAACASTVTPLVLELGGKSAALVLADADVDAAASAVAMGVAALSGQICVAPTRAVVHRSVHDQFVEKLVAMLPFLAVGDPFAPGTFAGPLISAGALERVLGIVQRSADAGAELVAGGQRLGGELADGFYMSTAVLTGVDPDGPLAQQEAFGPVLAVCAVDDVDEAVSVANRTRYGLAAYIHTRDLGAAVQIAGRLDAGNVGINGAQPVITPVGPFGGTKDSGYGREGGLHGLLEFTRVKNVNVALD
jgi:aldehyde dehydrogenase (NAD+)